MRTFPRTQFIGQAVFDGVNFNAGADFEHGKFSRSAHFNDTTFAIEADFRSTEFGSDEEARDSLFSIDSSFGGATFDCDAWFTDSTFSGKADFSEASFNGETWFSKAHFGADVAFEKAKIAKSASFADVTFAGNAWFDEVKAEGWVIVGPSAVDGELGLYGFEAGGDVVVTVGADQVKCTNAKFNDRAWLSLVGDLWLVDSVFAAPATIESSLRPVAGTGPGAGETPVRVRLQSLRGTDAEHLTLTDADLSRCVLSGLRRPEQLRLGGRCVFAPTPRGLYWRWRIMPWRWTAREALFEEHLWRSSQAAPGPHGGWAHPEPGTEDGGEATPERLEVLYRQLRASLEVASNEPGAADFYYGEMEMRRRTARRRSERWLLNGYWLVSGYGLRASRALLSLAALVFSAALVLQHTGFPGPVPGFLYCALYAAGSVVSLSLASGHLPAVLTAWGDVIRIVLRIGGPVLLGLAALAVRGRVKR
jgi:Pentapeptide repeats (9 copies)